MKYFFQILCCLILSYPASTFGQAKEIKLKNPSFEDSPRIGANDRIAPTGWFDCGKPGESAPDIHPGPSNEPFFEVTKESQDGNTYIGMVTRDNDTWESIAQRLPSALQSGKCYEFSIHLARSPIYNSYSRTSVQRVNFSDPIVLKIYGGNDYCNRKQLLAESDLVENYDWKKFNFRFEPNGDYNFITIEAYYKTPALFPYNGNVLVDNASNITVIPCDKPEVEDLMPAPEVTIIMPLTSGEEIDFDRFKLQASVLNIESKSGIKLFFNGQTKPFSFDKGKSRIAADVVLDEGKNVIKVEGRNGSGNDFDSSILIYVPKRIVVNIPPASPTEPLNKPTENLPEAFDEKIPAGSIVTLKNIVFPADSFNVAKSSLPILDDLSTYLNKYPDTAIEVGGHTNNLCDSEFCIYLSELRAKSVRDYLVRKGIAPQRLSYKGYGSASPITSNRTPNGRKKNQRVDIKVIKT